MKVISRQTINRLMKENNDENKKEVLSDILDDILKDEKRIYHEEYRNLTVAEQEINRFRTSLLNGGFGDDSTEDLGDIDYKQIEDFLSEKRRYYQMKIRSDLLSEDGSDYQIKGVFREETDCYYALFDYYYESTLMCNAYGLIVSEEHLLKMLNSNVEIVGYDFFGAFLANGWVFYKADESKEVITTSCFDLVTDLYSRNMGLLESSVLNKKTAVIVGCGSVGSYVALELVRAGVGHFVLVDSDTLEIHNICRHQLGFRDLGRFKVDAVSDAIKNINPTANVIAFKGTIQDLPIDFLAGIDDGIVIGTGDNRESSAYANDLAEKSNIPFLSIACWQRAHAGECFYWCPNSGLPKYRDAFKNIIDNVRPQSHQYYFSDNINENLLNFEPGISTDIEFVSNIGVKISYDLLNRDSQGYTMRVLGYLKNYTIICNSNNESIGGANAAIFPHPLYISNKVSIKSSDE